MKRYIVSVLIAMSLVGLHASPAAAQTARTDLGGVLLINQVHSEFPQASETRGQQVLMLLRHFDPAAEIVDDREYMAGKARQARRVVVLGNDAVTPLKEAALHDVRHRRGPTLWVGYGLGRLSADPDKEIGFAAGFVDSNREDVEVAYRGHRYPTVVEERHEVRIASPHVEVVASISGSGDPTPLAVRHRDFWFFAGLPALDTDYPNPAVDTLTLVFADLLSDFFGVTEHQPQQAVIRLEDVSAHIPPERITDAVDALARRRIPFVIGVIPAQQLPDGSVSSLRDRPGFVEALRYAQDRGGTVALHGYHHTFGQGEDFEFWDPEHHGPPPGETWEGYALKVEDGIRSLRDLGLDPLLWETPHYAASSLGYKAFASYFSHAIENRDPATWLPYIAGPDPSGQILIPENLGYINEQDGRTVEDQLARAELLQIVRDGLAVGFYHPAAIPVSDLERLADGLSGLGYRFADVRELPLSVDLDYEPSIVHRAATALRIEPGLTMLGVRQAVMGAAPAAASVGAAGSWLLPLALVCFFMWRLRAQWRPVDSIHASRVESGMSGRARRHSRARFALVAATALIAIALTRLAVLAPIRPDPIPPVPVDVRELPDPVTVQTGSWEISTYFTAVEEYYHGAPVELRGCPTIDCANGSTVLGQFPGDFLQAVKAEGSGRLAKPALGQSHLNWSIDTGYWLDSAARDARGSILQAFVSAAADIEIAYVSSIRIDDCGFDAITSLALETFDCDGIQNRDWIVRDRFTVGQVGKHIDLYVGEQDRADFAAESSRAVHATDATITISPYAMDRWAP